MAVTRDLAGGALGMNQNVERPYPKVVQLGSQSVEIRYMTASDGNGVSKFANRLPPHDLLFLPRDITHKNVLDAWLKKTAAGNLTTLLPIVQTDVSACVQLF